MGIVEGVIELHIVELSKKKDGHGWDESIRHPPWTTLQRMNRLRHKLQIDLESSWKQSKREPMMDSIKCQAIFQEQCWEVNLLAGYYYDYDYDYYHHQ
jgi:hypothetical protein